MSTVDDDFEEETPFFIMGCPRSGTTLAAQILDSHSRLAVYLETNYYGTFQRLLPMYGDLRRDSDRRRFIKDVLALFRMQHTDTPSAEEVERALGSPSFEGVLATFLSMNAVAAGKKRGGEKTPLHFNHLREILAGFPESPVLFLMRDPRDVVLSMRTTWGTPIAEGARVWNRAYLTYAANASSVQLVRYEDLVEDPVSAARAMCDALGETFEPSMLQLSTRLPDQLRVIKHLDPSKLSGPVVTTSVGAHQQMKADEVREIEGLCAMGMDAMGYTFTTSRPPITPPVFEPPNPLRHVVDRLRYHGVNPERWRRSLFRWQLVLRVRGRHLLTSGFLRAPGGP